MKPRIATLEGIFILSDTGHYEPEQYQEPDWPYHRTLRIAGISLSGTIAVGVIYCLVRAVMAVAGA